MCFWINEEFMFFFICDQPTRRVLAKPLIVFPNSIMRQWADELLKMVSPEAKLFVLIFHGSSISYMCSR